MQMYYIADAGCQFLHCVLLCPAHRQITDSVLYKGRISSDGVAKRMLET